MGDRPEAMEPEESWETRARAVLEPTGYDTELGAQVARDANRVVAGELSAEEFGQRYHDAYLEQFGRDARPDAPGASGDADDPAGARTPRLLTRREVSGALLGGAAGLFFLGGLYRTRFADSTPARTRPQTAVARDGAGVPEARPIQYGMVLDLTRCDGCLACVEACREENGLSDGVLWPYVFAYQEPDNERTEFLLRVCQQCSNAPCIKVCPTTARHRRPSDGLVLTDYDLCIGCRYCEVACPYGVNYFQWGDPDTYGGTFDGERRDARGVSVAGDPPRGVMGKCTYCPQRQDDPERRGTTACALACTMDVIHVGDMNDPDSEPNRYLTQRRAASGGRLATFRLLEGLGTEPNVVCIGSPPSSHATLVEGPVTYEELGLVENRRTALAGPTPWFKRMGASS
jgi:Fe-S-cluster-containing dehydrogenase component